MSDWIRPLFREASASTTWHIARVKGATTTTFCGESIHGALEVASSEERTERDGRCEECRRASAERQERSVIGAGRR